MGKAKLMLSRIPASLVICGTVIICMEIIGVAVGVETGRPTDALITWLATINGVLVTAATLLIRLESGNSTVSENTDKLNALLNGGTEKAVMSALENKLPELVGAILDARGVPVRATPMSPDPSAPSAPGVGSGHDNTSSAPPPTP